MTTTETAEALMSLQGLHIRQAHAVLIAAAKREAFEDAAIAVEVTKTASGRPTFGPLAARIRALASKVTP